MATTTTGVITQFILTELRIALVRRGWTQLDLARRLGCPVSTLSSWLRSVAPAPSDLIARIEHVLEIPTGSLEPVLPARSARGAQRRARG